MPVGTPPPETEEGKRPDHGQVRPDIPHPVHPQRHPQDPSKPSTDPVNPSQEPPAEQDQE